MQWTWLEEDSFFYKYVGLRQLPEEAKALIAITEGVRVALDELHSKGLAHLDVRLDNILCSFRMCKVD